MSNRLLFITQKVDLDDDVLGAYHRLIEKLADRVEKLSIICLYRGRVALPVNVSVYSLGKEDGQSRFKYLWRFYKYIWKLRRDYDSVFVHMNPEYIILGGFFWKLFRKKIFLWYNHPMGNWKARSAIILANMVFHTSPFAFAARYKKAKIMPVGVDVNLFSRISEIKKIPNSILYLGRLSPIKHVDVLIGAAFILDQQGVDFKLTIAGEPSKKSEIAYADSLKEIAKPLIHNGKIIFISRVSNYEAPRLYNSHIISINMTPTGSLDKTIIEAMACENLVLVSNKALQQVLPPECFFQEKNSRDLADKLEVLFMSSKEKKSEWGRRFRQYVINNHDSFKLVDQLLSSDN